MIHPVDGSFYISTHQWWLPGSFDSERAANLAFRLKDATLLALNRRVNWAEGRDITYDDVLAAYRSDRKEPA